MSGSRLTVSLLDQADVLWNHEDMAIVALRHADRPELWGRIPELFAGVWPEYNVHGDVMKDYWTRLYDQFSAFQVILYDEDDDEILAEGRSIPGAWDGTVAGLGSGIDAAIVAGFSGYERDVTPNVLCALGIEIPPHHQGRGLAKVILREMKDLARSAGFSSLIVPVRPTWKDRYPLIPIERYAAWRGKDGSPFDPWIRLHVALGGVIATPVPHSSRITGTVAEWESWTEMSFPDDGSYVFPGGLTTLHIDHRRDLGSYWEPNVWITHNVDT